LCWFVGGKAGFAACFFFRRYRKSSAIKRKRGDWALTAPRDRTLRRTFWQRTAPSCSQLLKRPGKDAAAGGDRRRRAKRRHASPPTNTSPPCPVGRNRPHDCCQKIFRALHPRFDGSFTAAAAAATKRERERGASAAGGRRDSPLPPQTTHIHTQHCVNTSALSLCVLPPSNTHCNMREESKPRHMRGAKCRRFF
jgi:hypothetical protein